MKTSTLLLGAAIALTAGLSGNAIADRDHGRGWDDHGRPGHYQERGYRGHPGRHGHRHRHHPGRGHAHYVYVPRPYAYVAPPRHSDGWYGIQLFLGGDL